MNMNEKNKIENCRIEPKLKLINMDSVEVEQVEWLLYPFIPYGKVTIIQGDPGEGKTTMVLQIIAKLTRGEPILPVTDTTKTKEKRSDEVDSENEDLDAEDNMQEQSSVSPVNVIYQTAEDGLGDYKYEQVIHHCAIGQFKPIVMNGLYEFSCGSIPDRGVHYGKKYMRKWLDSYDGKKFFVLKMDVHHFFESINRRILKRKLKAVIRDKRFYRLLCILIEHDKIALVAKILTDAGVEIDAEQTKTLVGCIAFDDISGALEVLREIGIAGAMFEELKIIIEEMRKGVPLGYFTSQWFGNFYLKALDHYIKEELHAEHYMRYMDDMVILGKSKKKLHKIHAAIETYLNDNLDLEIKGDWQVFRFEYPVFDKGGNPVLDKDGKRVTKGRMLDFMGFQFHHDRTTIRKSNIEAARRKANHISKQDKISWYNASVMLSYMGLFKHTDTYNYYIDYIKPKINVKKLKRIVSKHSRKENKHDRLEKGDRNTAGQAGGGRQDIVAVNGLPA